MWNIIVLDDLNVTTTYDIASPRPINGPLSALLFNDS